MINLKKGIFEQILFPLGVCYYSHNGHINRIRYLPDKWDSIIPQYLQTQLETYSYSCLTYIVSGRSPFRCHDNVNSKRERLKQMLENTIYFERIFKETLEQLHQVLYLCTQIEIYITNTNISISENITLSNLYSNSETTLAYKNKIKRLGYLLAEKQESILDKKRFSPSFVEKLYTHFETKPLHCLACILLLSLLDATDNDSVFFTSYEKIYSENFFDEPTTTLSQHFDNKIQLPSWFSQKTDLSSEIFTLQGKVWLLVCIGTSSPTEK